MTISNSTNPDAVVVPAPLQNIDWSKMRRQKKWLLARMQNATSTYEKGNALGLLNLVDNIQEYAVEELKRDPVQVWGREAMDMEEAG